MVKRIINITCFKSLAACIALSMVLTLPTFDASARPLFTLYDVDWPRKISDGDLLLAQGNPGRPDDFLDLSTPQQEDLERLLETAFAHYNRYGLRFERRIPGDIRRQYDQDGRIYRHGESHRSTNSVLDAIDRVAVSIAYRQIIAPIVSDLSSLDEKKAALVEAIQRLRSQPN